MMNNQYGQYQRNQYYGHDNQAYAVTDGYLKADESGDEHALSSLDTGASLTGLVDDLMRSPFATRLPGEDDPVGGLFEEKEQILRATVKHLADTLASRYELRDRATSMMNYEQC